MTSEEIAAWLMKGLDTPLLGGVHPSDLTEFRTENSYYDGLSRGERIVLGIAETIYRGGDLGPGKDVTIADLARLDNEQYLRVMLALTNSRPQIAARLVFNALANHIGDNL